MSNTRNNLLIINFSVSCWEGRKQSKDATKEVAEAHGTKDTVGRYHKSLFPDAEAHQNILKVRNAWRTWHSENTLPWGQDGSRAIRSSAFLDYTTGYRAHKERFEAAC